MPKNLAEVKIRHQIAVLAEQAGINGKIGQTIAETMLSGAETVEQLTLASFLDETTQRNYLQAYQARLKQLMKD